MSEPSEGEPSQHEAPGRPEGAAPLCASVALAPRAVVPLALALGPGTWRLTVTADAPVELAARTGAGAVRLRAEAGIVTLALDAPVDGFDVWPLDVWPHDEDEDEDEEEAAARATVVAEPAPPWDTLTPSWRLGPVRQPPRAAHAPRTTPPTPRGWSVRIAEAEAVEVVGERFEVGENGVLRLALPTPAGPGAVLVEGVFRTEDGAPARVEPQILASGAASPRSRLAAMRRTHGAHYAAVLTLDASAETLLLRPREYVGHVVIPALSVRPLTLPRRAARLAQAVRSWVAAVHRPAPVGARSGPLAPRPRRQPGRAGPPSARPLVSIVTATRDAPQHLARYLATIHRTRYQPCEILLVDNATRDAEALRWLEAAQAGGARVLRDARPFNFAALNNLAAREARGEILVFANNDIEFTDPAWLDALVDAASDPAVGVAGARLLYPDGRVQHAGLVLAGEARVRHAERYLPGRARGYEGRQRRETEVVGVTGALMAIRRTLFADLGGFDATRYGVLFNDVDLCLKARARGLSNVLVPAAVARHHESATIGQRRTTGLFERGGEIWQYERAVEGHRFRRAWADTLDADPCYPPQFDPLDARFRRRV
ncbi:glycosyltransferase family 2 protein [Acuticoccus sp. I52.16.1]|uniref:glycosyltransferase family 2 protein n=1 Tax=Acuticoccus sp. I52.16.1 TaxID=2928472 RepID=UPI001FD5CDA9|nr:glycosyltransferase family 2 protein [Acuticoccus sp. I52.16.1]UOM33935.1 glycosyltransferase family 2 protein [Acuticoccus sp. I52.16.1]